MKYTIDVVEKVGYLCEVEASSKKEAIEILKEDGCQDHARDINREIDWEDAHISKGGIMGD